MIGKRKRGLCLLLTLCLLAGLAGSAAAAMPKADLAAAVSDAAAYVCAAAARPQVGSIGGEWAVLGLARSGCPVPAGYFETYYADVESYVRACGGMLHDKKYTEYSRVILALSSMGKDAREVAGFDLTAPLGDFTQTVRQGLNGPVWALIALDSRDYPMPQAPEGAVQATRQMYVEEILARQLDCGGWNLTSKGGSGTADPDITGMALQALAKYQDQPAVARAIERALACMSAAQAADGGFGAWNTANSESVVQMIVALCELGIPLDDARFVKNGSTMLDNLMTYAQPGGGFRHTSDNTGSNQMASEQGLYGLTAALRVAEGKNSLYRMGDAVWGEMAGQLTVQVPPVTAAGKTFADLPAAHANRQAIDALAARGIVNGYDGSNFGPDRTMTRAEFAALIVRALGLPRQISGPFDDVPAGAWYAPVVGAAYACGIVNGTSQTTFSPEGIITRQEAAVMVARAARLCGLETGMEAGDAEKVLAAFEDGGSVVDWARAGMAFCCRQGILTEDVLRPGAAVLRCEVAQMVYNLLAGSGLL